MARKARTNYETAATKLGEDLINTCKNELVALSSIVQTRLNCDAIESWWAIRDAAKMQSAALMDLEQLNREEIVKELAAKIRSGEV